MKNEEGRVLKIIVERERERDSESLLFPLFLGDRNRRWGNLGFTWSNCPPSVKINT
jgi:hypothetical protein